MELNPNELWRRVPPEEKLELLNFAHAKGVIASLWVVGVGCTFAVGLQVSEIMWGSFFLVPLVFQYTVSKHWRQIRPKVMLEYLGARSVTRRYAVAANGRNLGAEFLFKGRLRRIVEDDTIDDDLDENARRKPDVHVWVALFPDSLIMISEGVRGANLEFSHLLDDKLTVTARSADGGKEYSKGREIVLEYANKRTLEYGKFLLTSRYPAALVVFEKKLELLHAAHLKTIGKKLITAKREDPELDAWDMMNASYSEGP